MSALGFQIQGVRIRLQNPTVNHRLMQLLVDNQAVIALNHGKILYAPRTMCSHLPHRYFLLDVVLIDFFFLG